MMTEKITLLGLQSQIVRSRDLEANNNDIFFH